MRECRALSNLVSQLIATEARKLNLLHYPGESIALWHIQQIRLEIYGYPNQSVGSFERILADRDGFGSVVASGGHAVELAAPNSPNPSLSSSNSGGNGSSENQSPRRRSSVTSY